MITIGEIISEKRKQLGLTQKDLAKKLGLGTTTIWNIECGNHYPSAFTLCDMADFFACTTDELLGRDTAELETAKSEAIKEFAEKLKEKAYLDGAVSITQELVVDVRDIDTLVEEMTEDEGK